MKPLVPGVLLAAAVLAAPRADGQRAGGALGAREEAGEMFVEACAACHTAPDPKYATDRAWLVQVADTA